MVVTNVVEVGENNRFRLYTEPLVIALLAALVVAWRWRTPRKESVAPTERGMPRVVGQFDSSRSTI
jgi:hypothetical protein